MYVSFDMAPPRKRPRDPADRPGLHLPGYNFCGPGTDLSRGDTPVNELDQACYIHDKDYGNPAIDTADADDRLIQAARDTGTLSGMLVAGIIGAKKQTDKYLFNTDKIFRGGMADNNETPPEKRRRIDEPGPSGAGEQSGAPDNTQAAQGNQGTGGAAKTGPGNVGHNLDVRTLQPVTITDDGTRATLRCIRRLVWWAEEAPMQLSTVTQNDTTRFENMWVIPSGMVLNAIHDESFRALREKYQKWRFKEQIVHVDNVLEQDNVQVPAAAEYVTQTVYKPIMRHMLYDNRYGTVVRDDHEINGAHQWIKEGYRYKQSNWERAFHPTNDLQMISGVTGNQLENCMFEWKDLGALKNSNDVNSQFLHMFDMKMVMDTAQMGTGFTYNVPLFNTDWMTTGPDTIGGVLRAVKKANIVMPDTTVGNLQTDLVPADAIVTETSGLGNPEVIPLDVTNWNQIRYSTYAKAETTTVRTQFSDNIVKMNQVPPYEIIVQPERWPTLQNTKYKYRFVVFYENVFEFERPIPRDIAGFNRQNMDMYIGTNGQPQWHGRRVRLGGRAMAGNLTRHEHVNIIPEILAQQLSHGPPTRDTWAWNSGELGPGLNTIMEENEEEDTSARTVPLRHRRRRPLN